MATGRGNGTRTRTVFLPTDFKSAVYANSTIPPYGRSGVDRTHDAGVKVLCLNRLATLLYKSRCVASRSRLSTRKDTYEPL